jgi:tripartite-type tricarboxylate transporter receptor subunit TctC
MRIARIGALIALTLGLPAAADEFPARQITLIAPWPPGGAIDALCRALAPGLGDGLGKPIVVENRPGAGSMIGTAAGAKAAPDGYTLVMAGSGSLAISATLYKKLPYDPAHDFAPIALIARIPFVLVVNPSVPAQSVRELIAYGKANPGKLSFASGNASAVLAGETLKRWADIDMLHVPYRSAPPAVQDVLGGRVSMLFTDMATGLPHYKAGTLRGLATTRLKRSALLPELPTLDEAGVKGFDMDSWAALFAPANLPPDIQTRLAAELRKIIDNPEVKAQIAATGFEAFSSSPQELDEFVRAQLVKWTKMIKDAGIQPE